MKLVIKNAKAAKVGLNPLSNCAADNGGTASAKLRSKIHLLLIPAIVQQPNKARFGIWAVVVEKDMFIENWADCAYSAALLRCFCSCIWSINYFTSSDPHHDICTLLAYLPPQALLLPSAATFFPAPQEHPRKPSQSLCLSLFGNALKVTYVSEGKRIRWGTTTVRV